MLVSELNRNRRIGTEFEFVLPQIGSGNGSDVRRTLAEVLSANGLPTVARGYSHRPVPAGAVLAVEYDGSVRGESRYRGIQWQSVELKTKILDGIDEWESIVPKALNICRYLGGRVNVSTGHHVHISMPEVKESPTAFRSIYNTIHRFEPLIYGLVAASRSTGHYAKPMIDQPALLNGCKNLSSISAALSRHPRTSGFNAIHLFDSDPRWESRYHGGTLDVDKARNWLRFMLKITDHACQRTCKAAKSQHPNNRESIDKMLVTLGLKVNSRVYAQVSPELRETGKFLLCRWKELNADQEHSLSRSRQVSEVVEPVAMAC
tara:strand:- start:298 stop:1254 length:957 start_codon:yes stop_codon:yes gene_type:complete